MLAGVLAFGLWGLLPIYFKEVDGVGAFEMLAHRVIWAVPFGAIILWLRRQWPEVWRALTNRRMLGFLGLSAIFITINWLGYIWAVQNGEIFQASLGYYINPLMYVLVGFLFLGERLRRFQVVAVAFATAGVVVLTISGGQFPAIALTLATSFTIYGVIRKQIVVGGMAGLFVETVLLFPVTLGYVLWLMHIGNSAFAFDDPIMISLLMLAGPITVLPLLCFALAARRLPLSTIGFLQFIAPTGQFIVGVAYGERLTTPHIICFSLIWLAVAVFLLDAWRASRKIVAAPL